MQISAHKWKSTSIVTKQYLTFTTRGPYHSLQSAHLLLICSCIFWVFKHWVILSCLSSLVFRKTVNLSLISLLHLFCSLDYTAQIYIVCVCIVCLHPNSSASNLPIHSCLQTTYTLHIPFTYHYLPHASHECVYK